MSSTGVKWIKITTDIFDDEKILLLEDLPEGDSIIVIWFKLLCLAGKMNNSGVFTLNDKIAYTDAMLATIFRRKEKLVRMALQAFERYGMIEIVDGVITIPNWGKHQNIDQIESKREYMKNYMRDYREKQGKIACKTNSKANGKTKVSRVDKDKDIENNTLLRECNAHAHTREGIGVYKNVFLSDNELEELMNAYPDTWAQMVNNLSSYMKSTGTEYASHYATIMRWADQDAQRAAKPDGRTEYSAYDYDDLKKWAEKED